MGGNSHEVSLEENDSKSISLPHHDTKHRALNLDPGTTPYQDSTEEGGRLGTVMFSSFLGK
jgi:hypothetical protein